MCFTVDQIERTCGFLLLNELNEFVYYCKMCQCEFDVCPDLEVHILSEHQDNKEAVLVNESIFMDDFEPTPIENDPIHVKIEDFNTNFILNEPIAEELIETDVQESIETNLNELFYEYKTPLVDSNVNYDFNNDNNSNESNKATDEESIGKKGKGRTNGSKKRRHSNGDESLIVETKKSLTKSPQRPVMRSKRKKIDESIEIRAKEPIPKR